MLEGKEFVKPIGKDGEFSVDVTPDLKVKFAVQYEKEIDVMALVEARVQASPGKADDKVLAAVKTLSAFLGKAQMNKSAVTTLIKQLASWIVTAVLGWSGPQGFITKYFLQWALKKGYVVLHNLHAKWKSHKNAEQRLDDYNKVINNPEATADDISKAGDDFFNR